MVKYQDEVLSRTGDVIPNATITVYNAGTSTLATLYGNTAGTVSLSNPVTADFKGYFYFYAGAGLYDLTVSGTGITTQQLTDIQLSPPSFVYNVKDYGAIGNGVADDTVAVRAAITAASADTFNHRVCFPDGKYKVTSTLSITVRGVTFEGHRGDRPESTGGSSIEYTGTGECIKIGTDNGHAHDAGEYDGLQGFTLQDMCLHYAGSSTSALNNGQGSYGTGTYGIRDWRGGDIKVIRGRVEGFNYGFWGIQSDINAFVDSVFKFNKYAFYLGPRCDQNSLLRIYALFNDTVAWLDSVKHSRWDKCQFVGNGSTTPDYVFKLGSAFTEPSRGNVFVDCWFEEYDPIAMTAFFGMGIGDSVTSVDTRIIRPLIVANSTYLASFLDIDAADYIYVDMPAFYRSSAPFSTAMFNFTNGSSTNIQLEQFENDSSFTVFHNAGGGTPKVTIFRREAQNLSLDYQAGSAQTSAIKFYDRGSLKGQLQKTAGGTIQLFEQGNSIAIVRGGFNSVAGLNSQGSGAIELNKDANSGTGGTQFWSGGASPSQVGSVDSTGIAIFNGGITAGSYPVLNVANQGYFVGGTVYPNGTSAGTIISVNNQVRAFQFVLPFRCTVGQVSIDITTTIAASLSSVGIYSADGTSKLIDSGTFDTSSGTVKTNSITPVTLNPGAYYFAYTANDATVQLRQLSTGTFGASALNAQSQKKAVVCGNAATAGVLPSSLGTLTASSGVNIPIAIFER